MSAANHEKMLLSGWTKEITRAECRPEAQTVHCIARLNEDISAVIPYLNTVLGGYTCILTGGRSKF